MLPVPMVPELLTPFTSDRLHPRVAPTVELLGVYVNDTPVHCIRVSRGLVKTGRGLTVTMTRKVSEPVHPPTLKLKYS